jgi:cystathionine beta-lyase
VGYVAAAAAYNGGAPWLESLLERVDENYQALCAEFNDRLPEAIISPLEGTYLVWIDLRRCLDPANTKFIVQEVCGLAVDYGDWFGGDAFKGFIRLNLATSLDNVMLAVSRLLAALTD